MMYVKAGTGDGCWQIWGARPDVEFVGRHSMLAVPVDDHDLWDDDGFPTDDVHRITFLAVEDPDGDDRLVRWVKWTDPDDHPDTRRMLVTDGPVYLLDGSGQTVEALV